MATIKFKRGDSFEKVCTCLGLDGSPLDLTGYTFRAQLKGPHSERFTFTVVDLDQAGDTLGQVKLVSTYEETALWPLGDSRFDIEYTSPDDTRASTETVILRVLEDVTL